MRPALLPSTCVYLNNNRRYDRPGIFHELQVNVPRTMDILRDDDFPVPAHFNQTNHTLEDMKVAVLKAGLTNQDYRKKQEMRLIFKYGAMGPSVFNQDLSFAWFTFFSACSRRCVFSCGTRVSIQLGTLAFLTSFLTVFSLVPWRRQHCRNVATLRLLE